MKRFYILQGDKTTSGGTVVDGLDCAFHHGTKFSFLGASVSCPACGTNGVIVPVGPRRKSNLFGKQFALEGDVCCCRCHPSPKLIASQRKSGDVFEAHELVEMGLTPQGVKAAKTPDMNFDERIRVVDSAGLPMAGVPYHIRTRSGAIYKGLTNSEGYSERVYTEKEQQLDVALGGEALARWNA
ncbi:PAAR domain-containing protein [Paraburkholderia edwinii]|jgi:uncharacterized Zn-binding protein involved in type VI secretion|uniref:PAAR domain-containing protein n=1 Tax=Paraburkholderia edwinii TaxID=2861782 RepID=UPI001FEB08E7|nr:PAAR domain-containing protein [Paraburkholderia edwinii]